MSPLVLYKSLADDTRLKVLLLLHSKKSLCVCDLIDSLDLSQPKVSRHLADLRKADLVTGTKQGKWVHYRINESLPGWVLEVIQLSAENNQDYLAEPLSRLAPITQSESCQ